MKNKKQAIGVFDSGVGGLTVFKEIRKKFPYEDIIYFGDTARVPYGPKSKHTVIDYSIQNTRFLIQEGVKMVVIACNTSSAVSLDILQKIFDIPIIGVIEAGSRNAIAHTKKGRIGVIGTEGTIRSEAYKKTILSIKPDAEIYSKACPLFVSLAEEGWVNHPITKDIANEYLYELKDKDIDTLVLGCTHYPILKPVIQEVIGKDVHLVDSAISILSDIESKISKNTDNCIGKDFFFVSDNEDKFCKIAQDILNINNFSLSKVKLGETWYIENNYLNPE
ncbi:MAG TPA: glutamate racemase [Candidatus Cloacimonadota bacterium]|jgi:glutamate racemase|nr:glutamate racemase [Candidatus Cloacimonadales bacterium]HPY96290.1 glutamate racemase [Candidatus Cloacimonadota bacterium]HQB40214.1 glutamate racemase [Candidatus Cloacimonadota bacterium]